MPKPLFEPGTRRVGRKKGVPNKTTAAQREAILAAFTAMGGVPALVRWGKTDRASFYRLWGSIIPKAIEGPGADGELTIRIRVEGLTEAGMTA